MINLFRFIFVFILIYCTSAYADNIKGDINDDEMVNAAEAIYALQVTAGFKQQLTTNEIDGHSLNAADGNPVNALYIDNEGKVGIGTDKPESSLTVRGKINYAKALSGHVMILKDSNRVIGADTLFTEELKIGDTISIDGSNYSIQQIVDNDELFISSNVTQTLVEKKIYVASDLLQIQSANAETKLVLDKKGNLGIGNKVPNEKLDVNGNIVASGTITGKFYSHYDHIERENESIISKNVELKENAGVLFITSYCTGKYQSTTMTESGLVSLIYIDDSVCSQDSSYVSRFGSLTHRASTTCIKKLNAGMHELKVECGGLLRISPNKISMQYMILNDK